MKRSIHRVSCWLMLAVLGLYAEQVSGQVVHDEGVDGDMSDNYQDPTILALSPGINSLIVTTGGDDYLEYFRINLPAGHQLSQLIMNSYEGVDETAFISIQSGTQFTFPDDEAFNHINDMLGWTHFGPGQYLEDFSPMVEGSDILPVLGNGGQTFEAPLNGPTYTFWLQQTGSVCNYQLDFIVTPVPEPASLSLVGILAVGGVAMRRIRRR
jgi:hypothetical protein